jgi:hypothetical protein
MRHDNSMVVYCNLGYDKEPVIYMSCMFCRLSLVAIDCATQPGVGGADHPSTLIPTHGFGSHRIPLVRLAFRQYIRPIGLAPRSAIRGSHDQPDRWDLNFLGQAQRVLFFGTGGLVWPSRGTAWDHHFATGTSCFGLSLRCLGFVTPNPSSSQPVANHDLKHWILLAQSCPHLLHH